ncbi:MAG: IS1595 family transposase, partial [Bacteroidota bacterium]|nr:IS1595 family transposase [Bacteroidota bacterium]
VHKKSFYLHIKECEFRYNYRNQNIYVILLNSMRKNKLN